MKPKTRQLFRSASLATLTSICITLSGHAASLVWDGNGDTVPNPDGGSGTWDVNATANWWDGAANVAWPALGGSDDDAVFGNTAGTVTLSSAITAHDLTFNTTGYILSGAYTLTLNGTTPTITTLSGVTATLGNNTALVIDGTAGLTKAGGGTLVLNGSAVNTFTGGLTISGGILNLDFVNLGTTPDLINNGNTLILSGGTLTLTGNEDDISSQTFNGLTLNGANSLSATATGTGEMNVILGTITRNAGAVVHFTLPTGGTISTTTGLTNGILGTWATTGTGADTRYITLDLDGKFSALTGGTAAGTAAALTDTTGTVNYDLEVATGTVLASRSMNTIRYWGTAGTTTPGTTSFTVNGLMNAGSGLWTIGTNAITIGADKDLVVNSANNSITISSIIKNNGAGASSLTKTGSNTLTLTGVNTFTGVVHVNAGTVTSNLHTTSSGSFLGGPGTAANRRVVNIAAGSEIAYTSTTANSFLNLGTNVATGGYGAFYDFNIEGTLKINDGGGVSQILQSTYNLNGGGVISNTGSAHTGSYGLLFGWSAAGGGNINVTGTGNQITADRITFHNGAKITTAAGASLTISSIIKNSGSVNSTLTKEGAGLLVLTGANTYSGLTTVSGGTLAYGANNAIGTGAVTISDGTLDLGNFTDSVADVTLTASSFIGTGTLTATAFNINNSLATSVSANLAGTAALTKTLAGTLELTGVNSYTGSTTVSSGILEIGGSGQLGSGSYAQGISLGSGATLNVNSSAAQTFSGAITGAGALSKDNTGVLTLTSDSHSFSGGLALNGGTLLYRPTAAVALDLGSGGITLAAGTRIGTALGGTASQSAINSSGVAQTTGSVTVDIWVIPGATHTLGSNNLITASSGLDGASYTIGNVFNNTDFIVTGLSASAAALSMTAVSATPLSELYWKGGFSAAPSLWAISNGSTASNWASTAEGADTGLVPGADSTVIFSANSASNQDAMTLGANMSVKGITVTSSDAVNLNGDGNTLTLGSAGITLNSGAGVLTLAPPIIMAAAQSWTNNSSNLLNVSVNVANSGFNLTSGGSGNTQMTLLSGTGGLTKADNGTLTLNGAGITYTGATTVNSGTLTTINTTAFASTVTVNTGATLRSADTANRSMGANFKIVLNGGTLWHNQNFYRTHAGLLTVSADSVINCTNTSTNTQAYFDGGATGAGNLTINNSGNAIQTGVAFRGYSTSSTTSLSGVVTVNGGIIVYGMGSGTVASTALRDAKLNLVGATLQMTTTGTSLNPANETVGSLNGNSTSAVVTNTALTVGGRNDHTAFAGIMSGSGSLIKTGSGTMILSGANTYTGGTTVSSGALIVTGGLANGAVTVATNATFGYRPLTAGALALGSGVLNLAGGSRIGTALGGDDASQSAITSSSAALTTGTITVDVSGIPGATIVAGSNNLITAASGLNGASSYVLGNVFNNTNFTVTGLTSSATDVSITAVSATPLTDAYWKGGFTTAPSLWAISNGSTASNWASTAGGADSAVVPGTDSTVIFSATTASNQDSMTLGANMSIKGISVANSAAVGLNPDNYTLTLGTGGIAVNSAAGAVTLGSSIALAAAQSWTNDSSNVLTVSGNIANGGFDLTSGGSGNTTINSIVSGNAGLTKTGAGTLTLSGVNTHSGVTTVSGGTLALAHVNALATSTLDTGSTGTQQVTFAVAGSNTYNLGNLQGSDDLAIGANTISVGAKSAAATFSGAISGSGGNLTKVGTGLLTLEGTTANTYTGMTTITGPGGLKLNKSADVTAVAGDLTFVGSVNPYTMLYTTANNQLSPNSVINFTGVSYGIWELLGTTQTVAGINSGTGSGIIENHQFYPTPNSDTGTLVLAGAGTYSFAATLRNQTGVIALSKTGTGTQTLSGASIIHTGATTVSGGVLELETTTAWNSNIINNATVEFSAAGNWTIGAGETFSGSGTYIKTGSGILYLSNHIITATGQFLIQEGTFQNNTNSCNWINSTADMDISAGATLDLYADDIYVDALTGAGTVNNGFNQAQKLTVGVADGNGTFTGILKNTSNVMSLVKTGSGTQILTGDNIYSGTTTVDGGTLLLNNTSGSGTGSGAVTVNSTATLGGTGSISGATTIASGGTLAPGNSSIGTLTTGSLTLASGSNATFEFDTITPANDQVTVNSSGGLTLNGAAFTFLDVGTSDPSVLTVGTAYTLINYSGSINGLGVGALSVANPIAGTAYGFFATGTEVKVRTGSQKIWDGSGADANWNTAGAGGNWSNSSAPALFDALAFGGTAKLINNNDLAANTQFSGITFNADAGAFTLGGNALNLVGNLTNHSSALQTLSLALVLDGGSRSIDAAAGNILLSGVLSEANGSWGIIKTGANTLTLSAANTYTGATTIAAGTLELGDAGQLGGGTYANTISNDGNLLVNSSATQTLSGIISGTGSVTKSNSGSLTLSAANTYSGGTTISAGTVSITSTGFGSGGVWINSGATADLAYAGGSYEVLANNFSGGGSITKSGSGDVRLTGDNSAFTGTVTHSGVLRLYGANAGSASADWTVGVGAQLAAGSTNTTYKLGSLAGAGSLVYNSGYGTGVNWEIGGNDKDTIFSGVIANSSTGTPRVTKVGSGTLTLTGSNPYAGGTTVSGGTLEVGGTGTLGAGTISIAADSTLLYNSSATQTLTGQLTINGSLEIADGQVNLAKGGTAMTNNQFNAATGTILIRDGGILNASTQHAHTMHNNIVLQDGGVLTSSAPAVTNYGVYFYGATSLSITGRGLNNLVSATSVGISSGIVLTLSTVDSADRLTVSSRIGYGTSGTAGGLAKTGDGIVTLTGTNTYTGGTTVSGGTLLISGAAGTISGSSGVTVSGGGILKLDNSAGNYSRIKDTGTVTMNGGTLNFFHNAAAVNYSETTGALTVASGSNTISTSQAASGKTSTLTFDSLARTAGGIVDFSGSGLGVDGRNKIAITSNPTLTHGIMGGWATYNGSGWASYDATRGVVAYTGYTDLTRLSSVDQVIANTPANNVRIMEGSGTAANLKLTADATINSLFQSTSGGTSAATIDTADYTLRLGAAGGILTQSGAGTLTIGTGSTVGVLTAGGAADTAGDIAVTSNAALIVNSVIANNGAGIVTLSKGGTATMTLNGISTYTGNTAITAGTLEIGGTGKLGNGSYAGAIALASGATLNVNTSAAQTLSGTINGAGVLIKNNTGTLTLTGVNTYTGNTALSGGTLEIGGAGQLGSGSYAAGISTAANTLLKVNSTATQALNGAITGDGALTKDNTGTLTLNGENSYSGATTIHAGTLALGSAGTLASASLIVGDADSTTAVLDVTAKSGFSLSAGQTLSGVGTVNAGAGNTLTIADQSTHAVGNASVAGGVGSQTVTGNLSYASGSIFEWDLNANSNTGAGSNFDAVTVNGGLGSLSVDSGAIFKIVLGSGVDLNDSFWSTPNTTQTWTDIFSHTGLIGGGFTTSNLQVVGTQLNGIGSFTISGSTLTWTAVPETSSVFAGLLLGAGLLRRRRK